MSLGVRTLFTDESKRLPSIRSFGFSPTVMWRSEAPFWIISWRRTRRFTSVCCFAWACWVSGMSMLYPGVRVGFSSDPYVCAAVSLITSSSDVMPRSTFFRPSMRSVSIPSSRAMSWSSSVLASVMIAFRTRLVTAITS